MREWGRRDFEQTFSLRAPERAARNRHTPEVNLEEGRTSRRRGREVEGERVKKGLPLLPLLPLLSWSTGRRPAEPQHD